MSDDNKFSIISVYEANRSLWDPANRDYCNKIKKNQLPPKLQIDLALPSRYHVILNVIILK